MIPVGANVFKVSYENSILTLSRPDFCQRCSICLQPTVAFHVETSHLIYIANQMTGFYITCNTGLECVNMEPFSHIF